MFNPSRLQVARNRRRMSKSELASKLGVALRSVTAFEGGQFAPAADTLEKIASVLDFPIGWFSGNEVYMPSADTASFRSQARMTASNRHAALALGAFAVLFNDWMENRFTLPAPDLLDFREEEPEAAAMMVRQHWGLGERPVKNMVHLLESKGVRVFSMAEDTTEVDAFSFWNNTTPYVFLNTRKSAERSRFDAAHELGHLVLHRHDGPKEKQDEPQANKFASSFLMPRGSIISHAPVLPTVKALIQLKKTWIVSVAALAHRLYELGIVTEWHYRSLCIDIGQRGYRSQEPNEAMREMSLVFPQLFRSLLRDDGIRKSDVATDLHINVEELDKMVFGLLLLALDGGTTRPRPGSGRANLRLVK